MRYKPEIKKGFFNILSSRPNAKAMIESLESNSELLLFGGCIRDYMEHGFHQIPRDFDIVLSNSDQNLFELLQSINCSMKPNKFGGFKVIIDDLKFDFWHLKDTWAFKNNKVSYNNINDLNKTVFLNIDAAFYNLSNRCLYDEYFTNAINNKVLDIILTENPFPDLNITKAFKLKHKYDLGLSKQLSTYFINWVNKQESKTIALEKLKNVEIKRYKSLSINWDYEYEFNKDKI
jgi:hypothetical protein